MTQTKLFIKQKQTDTENRLPNGKGRGEIH